MISKTRFTQSLSVLALIALTGCGKENSSDPAQALNPLDTPDANGMVVKGRTTIEVSTGGARQAMLMNLLLPSAYAAAGNQTVTTTVGVSTTFALDNSLFMVPTAPTPFAVNNFGTLQLANLQDNQLKVCGTNGKTKCGTAMIRIYTTGTSGAGLWNADDQYGAPITAGKSTLAPVGLNASGAAIVQQISIPANKHVLTLQDFASPKYAMEVDFTQAGTGTYSSTLVIEYALGL